MLEAKFERRVRVGVGGDSMLPLLVSFLSLGPLAVPVVVVESALDCPTASRVSEELERIVPNTGTPGTDRATVARDADSLLVLLRAADGSVLGERRVTAEGTCEEQARAVSVILGTWITDIHPEYRTALPVPEPTAPVDEPEPAPAPPAAPPSPPPPPAPPPPRVTPERPRAQATTWHWSGGAALGVEVSDASAVFVGALSSSYAPDGTGFGGAAFALLAAPARRSVGSGSADALRWPLGLGPLLRVQAPRAYLDVSAGPTLAWLHIAGAEFVENRTANDVVAGAFGRARVGVRWRSWRPFLEAGILGWFGSAKVVARSPDAELELAAYEPFFLVGAALEP